MMPRSGLLVDSLRLLAVLAALVAAFGLGSDQFFGVRTFQAIAHQVPALLIASVGMTFVLMVGAIDLSIGSVLALAGGVLGVVLLQADLPLPLAMLAAIGTAVGIGLLNAAVILRWRLPSFIVTLGMLEMARGAAYLVTSSQTQYIGARVETIAHSALAGVPLPFLLAVLIVGAGQAILSRTVFGRHVVAVGTNEEAVRLAGVDTRRIVLGVFVLSGVCTGLAAVIHAGRLAAADPNAGVGFELQAIAAVVIGGTSLMGGRGSVVGSLFGVLIIAVLDTGLAQIGAQEPVKRLVTGAVIIAAVVLDNYRHRRWWRTT
jgi:ribose transport system permease protein